VDNLADEVEQLQADLAESLSRPDQADFAASLASTLNGRHGLGKMMQVTQLVHALDDAQRRLAETHQHRALRAEVVAKERRKAAREAARALAPQHRAVAARMAAATEGLIAAVEDEAKLHDGLRREFGDVPLPRLGTLDLGALRRVLKSAKAYAGAAA
jgi:hypothetical protein